MNSKPNNPNPDHNIWKTKPWYKHPWVWFMLALPASAVVAGLYTVYIANQHPPIVIAKQNKFQIEND